MSKRLPSGPGPKAKRGGTVIKNGKAIQVTCYPRARTKAVLVSAAEAAGQGLSAFLILAGLEKIARAKSIEVPGVTVEAEDLIPKEEYSELLRKRGGRTKG